MNNLKEVILEKKEQLSNTVVPHEQERDFLDTFLKKYNANDFDTYEQISNVAYFMAVLLANGIKMSFEELVDNLQKIQIFINDIEFDIKNYYHYLDELEALNNAGILEKIVNKEELTNEEQKQIKKYKKYTKGTFTSDTGEFYYEVNKVFDKLFLCLPKQGPFKSFIGLHLMVMKIKDLVEGVVEESLEEAMNDEMFSDFDRSLFKGKSFDKFIQKEKKAMIKEQANRFMEFIGVDFNSDYALITKYYQNILKEDKEIVKMINKQIRALDDLEYKLKYVKDDRLMKYDEDTKKLLIDSKINYYYLLSVISHNYEIYKKAETKNIEYKENSITKLEILFSKYGFNFNNFNEQEKENILNKTSIEQLEKLLNSIKYSELSFISEYVGEFAKIVVFSKPEIISFIDSLLKNKIIDKKFIFKNTNILYNTNEFYNLYQNANYLSSIGINLCNLVKDNSDILLQNNNKTVKITNILNEYNVSLNKDDVYNFDILKDEKVLDLLDNYIELGLKDIVLDNPKYLTSDSFDIIKRLMICSLGNINPINKSNKIIGSVTTGNNFYVEPKDYDNYIIDYKVDYLNPICVEVLKQNKRNTISSSTKNRVFIQKLDELYMKDDLTYVINGVTISRNRVLRNLELLLKHLFNSNLEMHDLVYQAILYKMIDNIELDVLEGIYNSIYLINIEIEKNKTYTLK